MSEALWTKNYLELAAAKRPGFYSASVDTHPHGGFVFRAFPNQGDWVVECITPARDTLLLDAERWLNGELPEGFYTASW